MLRVLVDSIQAAYPFGGFLDFVLGHTPLTFDSAGTRHA